MRNAIVRDGIVAGVLGATAVAVLFFGIDVMYGRPLGTPAALGQALLSFFRPPVTPAFATAVISYTIFHYAAFIATGLAASGIVHWAQNSPTVLAGAMMLFVAFEIGFSALSFALRESPALGVIGWAQVATGNLLAALVMGGYLWRRHPELRGELGYALGGRD